MIRKKPRMASVKDMPLLQDGPPPGGFLPVRALKEEKYAARRAILPILQAEEDERFVSEWNKYLDYEADVMKDVPGWKVV
ncbi:hypothetical protein YC2023_036009 [Brassica napus]